MAGAARRRTRPVPGRERRGLPARAAAQAILSDVLRKRRPLDAALERLAICRSARRRLRARHRRRNAAPLRPARRAHPPLRRQAAAAAQGGADARDPAAGRVRASVSRRRAACRRRRRQPSGAGRRQGRAFQAADQRRAAPRRARRRRGDRGAGCRAPQHAGLALDALERAYGEDTHARHRRGASCIRHRSISSRRHGALPSCASVRQRVAHRSLRASKTLPGFAEGELWVQDAAATLPAHLLGDVRGQARDRSVRGARRQDGAARRDAARTSPRSSANAARMTRLKENLARLKLDATLIESDVRDCRCRARALRAARCALHRHRHDPPPSRSAVDQERLGRDAGAQARARSFSTAPPR